MRILLISGRSTTSEPHPSRAVARRLATEMTARGHEVRWLCPVEPGEGFEAPPSGRGEVVMVETSCPPFRSVQGRLADLPTERALCREIRARLPDVVHVLAFGGGSSALLAWIAQRLGAPAVVSTSWPELVCHRGTLVHASGEVCATFDDPGRCLGCCTTPTPGGLSGREATLARLLRWLPALTPYPRHVDFENRLDLVIGGLVPAACVLVSSVEQAGALERLGVPRRLLRVQPEEPTPAELEDLHRELARRFRADCAWRPASAC